MLEIGLDHGSVLPIKHVRMVSLAGWPSTRIISEYVFYCILLGLIGEMMWHFGVQFQGARDALEDEAARRRFELRYKVLHEAAFTAIFPYRPRVLMAQIAQALKACPEEHRVTIGQLNKIGKSIPKLHANFQLFMRTNDGQKKARKVDAQLAVTEVLSSVLNLDREEMQLVYLSDPKTKTKNACRRGGGEERMSPRWWLWSQWIRFKQAVRTFGQDGWRV